MKFSKKKPLKVLFSEKTVEKGREVHVDAYSKIMQYKNMLKSNPDIADPIKEEIKYEIQRNRGRLRFHKFKNREAKLKYKGIEISVPTNELGLITPSYFQIHINKIKDMLSKRRKLLKQDAKEVRQIEGVRYELHGGVRETKNTIAQMFREIGRKRVNSNRKPDASENHVGVEIEFISAFSREDIAELIIDAKLSKHVRLKTDGSIRASDKKPIPLEMCIVAPESKIIPMMEKVCGLLASIEAEANISCGLHVHLDCRNRDRYLLFHNLVVCQDLLFSLVASSRQGNNYCKKQSTTDWNLASNEHYAAINKLSYERHKTIEVRMHHGTVAFPEIKNWITLLMKIANYNEKFKDEEKKLNKLASTLSFDKELSESLTNRIKVYNP